MEPGQLAKYIKGRNETLTSRGFRGQKLYYADIATQAGEHVYLLVLAANANRASQQAHEIARKEGARPAGADIRRAKPEDMTRDDYLYVPGEVRDSRSDTPKVAQSKIIEGVAPGSEVPSILPKDRF